MTCECCVNVNLLDPGFGLNVRIVGCDEEELRARCDVAGDILKEIAATGKMPVALPKGIGMEPNHGTGGGP